MLAHACICVYTHCVTVPNPTSRTYLYRHLLAQGGRFVEIGKRDILSHEDMNSRRPDVDYHVLAFDHIIETDPAKYREVLTRVCLEVDAGVYKAQSMTALGCELSHS